jgi:hypothetical protein
LWSGTVDACRVSQTPQYKPSCLLTSHKYDNLALGSLLCPLNDWGWGGQQPQIATRVEMDHLGRPLGLQQGGRG